MLIIKFQIKLCWTVSIKKKPSENVPYKIKKKNDVYELSDRLKDVRKQKAVWIESEDTALTSSLFRKIISIPNLPN